MCNQLDTCKGAVRRVRLRKMAAFMGRFRFRGVISAVDRSPRWLATLYRRHYTDGEGVYFSICISK